MTRPNINSFYFNIFHYKYGIKLLKSAGGSLPVGERRNIELILSSEMLMLVRVGDKR